MSFRKIKTEVSNELEINTDKFQHYMDVYELYFNRMRNKPLDILEIGVKNGQSLNLWKKYFKNGNIWGMDIDPKCKKYESDRIKIIIGDQNLPATFELLSDQKFDIIIDDGSHVGEHIINSFKFTWEQMLKPGGLYFIEDTTMIFHDVFNSCRQDEKSFESFWNEKKRMLNLDLFSCELIKKRLITKPGAKANFNHPIARKVKTLTGIDKENFNNDIFFIHFYCSLIVLKKKSDMRLSCWEEQEKLGKKII